MNFETLIAEIERRNPTLSKQEIARNKHHLALGRAVGAFEGVEMTPEAEKLSQLVAEGRIRTKDAAKLALKYA